MHTGIDLLCDEAGAIGLRGRAKRVENREHGAGSRIEVASTNTVIKYSIFLPADPGQFPGMALWLCSA
ncbi:hypothetical protein GCM10027032_22030 [Simplicispira piscis]